MSKKKGIAEIADAPPIVGPSETRLAKQSSGKPKRKLEKK